ncbi:Dinitrogenase iron-molybdenum cofactor biosynthesis protein [uncultured Pleomorphomonas sp.]|uniref:Dinitrogenase iron-molybdenum cofactor biosynthesis protein n=1 Tax=uncultured Pleomorphomonas sp. TaxID=442121 RepID=A0A212LHF4_9HYPH|nr:NifB/NifX family molybdenum-iron cluster-binding protein [uncultured Pleomorphomonas sp.]SCM76920.1 Dinitrogenase iron-molybdenum cofactor biosynthesis protein [uncultured Pleomorphomonas sp.]
MTLSSPVRVAIGTASGARVSEHFGHATRFEIWEVGPAGTRFLETRNNRPACGSGCGANFEENRADEVMDASVALVADCRAVVVSRLGECAINRLSRLGILAFETDDRVDDALRELAAFDGLFTAETAA